MRISAKPLAPLSLLVGLVIVLTPLNARADIIGTVLEGQSLTVGGFAITNTNPFAAPLSGLATSVLNPNFMGDPGDFVTAVFFAPGGTCVLGGVLAPGAACTVNLTFTTPAVDVGEPVDFGVSQIILSHIFDDGPVISQTFEIQVDDVPEPESATLVSLGIAILASASAVARKWRLIHDRQS